MGGSETYNDVIKKLQNTYETGLVDKLKKKLHFYIMDFTNQESVNKLLYMLYRVEKYGKAKKYGDPLNKSKLQIIDILARPVMSNVNLNFSNTTAYGSVLQEMIDEMRNEIGDLDERENVIQGIQYRLENIIDKTFDYVVSDLALKNKDSACNEINRMIVLLNDILKKLPDISNKKYDEEAIPTFANLLLSHKQLCLAYDRINIMNHLHFDEMPDKRYSQLYLKYECAALSTKDICNVAKKVLNNKFDDEYEKLFLYFIVGTEHPTKKDLKECRNALRYADVAMEWVKQFKGDEELKDNFNVTIFASIIQEIRVVQKNKIYIKNTYFGNDYIKKSLLSALKHPQQADALLVDAWVTMFENRCAYNYGALDALKLKRKLDELLLELTVFIFSYHNLNDMKSVFRLFNEKLTRSLLSSKAVDDIQKQFMLRVSEYCNMELNFLIPGDAGSSRGFFRDLFYVQEQIESIARQFADQVKQCCMVPISNISGKVKIFKKSLNFDFKILNEPCEAMLHYHVCPECSSVILRWYGTVIADDEAEHLISLGLEKFIVGKNDLEKFRKKFDFEGDPRVIN